MRVSTGWVSSQVSLLGLETAESSPCLHLVSPCASLSSKYKDMSHKSLGPTHPYDLI